MSTASASRPQLGGAPASPVSPVSPASPARAALGLGNVELIALLAMLMALNALAIDMMLPALGAIAADLDVPDPNDRQLVIIAYVLGFGVPQLVWGPFSDAFGRRRVILLALFGYALSAFATAALQSFSLLLAMRFVQGVFAAGCRVIAVAVVRDLFKGAAMARTMSLIMTVFMIIPITAPALGQGVLLLGPWRAIFVVLGGLGSVVALWVAWRLPDTLPEQQRTPLALRETLRSYGELLQHRASIGYTLAGGVIFGALFAFISSSEQVFREVFDKESTFVFWFAGIAGSMAVASITNAMLVRRFGMRRLSHGALVVFTVLAATLLGLTLLRGDHLGLFYPLFALNFALFGLLGANFNAMAMEPLSRVAGVGAAAYGFATTTLAGFLGGSIGRAYDGSTVPLVGGFFVLGLSSLLIVLVTERGRLFGPD